MSGYGSPGYGLAPSHSASAPSSTGPSLGYKPVPTNIPGDEDITQLIGKYDLKGDPDQAVRSALHDLGYDPGARNADIQGMVGQGKAIRQAYLLHQAGQDPNPEDPTGDRAYANFVRDVVSRGSTRSIFSSVANNDVPRAIGNIRALSGQVNQPGLSQEGQAGLLSRNPATTSLMGDTQDPSGAGYTAYITNLYRNIWAGDPGARDRLSSLQLSLQGQGNRNFYNTTGGNDPSGRDLWDYLMTVNPNRL